MKKDILILHPKDNVATVLMEISEGFEVKFEREGKKFIIKANKKIPIYHKIAIEDLKEGVFVIKYGEVIGLVKKEIKKGDHVHQKNIKSTFA